MLQRSAENETKSLPFPQYNLKTQKYFINFSLSLDIVLIMANTNTRTPFSAREKKNVFFLILWEM